MSLTKCEMKVVYPFLDVERPVLTPIWVFLDWLAHLEEMDSRIIETVGGLGERTASGCGSDGRDLIFEFTNMVACVVAKNCVEELSDPTIRTFMRDMNGNPLQVGEPL